MQNTRFLNLHGCSCVFGSLSLSFYIFIIFRPHHVYRPNECEWLEWLDLDSYIAGTITGYFHIHFEITNSKCPHFSSVTPCLLTTRTWDIVNFSWSKHTKGSEDHKNASSHSSSFFFLFFFFSKNKVSLSDATVCVDASKEYLQFLNKSQSQGSNAQICENPTASFQKCFSCLFWCIVVKMKMCQQIKNVSKLFFYIKGIPQNFCPSEALQGSWKASYLFRASQQASYLFRASQQASYLFRASQQASYLFFFRASQQASYLFRASQQALYCFGPLSKPQSPFRGSWQASIPIQGLLASLKPF